MAEIQYKIADKPTLDAVKKAVDNLVLNGAGSSGFVVNGQAVNNKQTFLVDGTFVVPEGVTTLYITACGGGGGGGSRTGAGLDGGDTIIGSLLTLKGGRGGQISVDGSTMVSGGAPGGTGGTRGGSSSRGGDGAAGGASLGGGAGGTGGTQFTSAPDGLYAGGGSHMAGGGGLLGKGASKYSPGDYGASPNGRGAGEKPGVPDGMNSIGGAGGGFGAGGAGISYGAGGGGAAAVYKQQVTVNPGDVINITIARGGNGGPVYDSTSGGGGGSGICIIEW